MPTKEKETFDKRKAVVKVLRLEIPLPRPGHKFFIICALCVCFSFSLTFNLVSFFFFDGKISFLRRDVAFREKAFSSEHNFSLFLD